MHGRLVGRASKVKLQGSGLGAALPRRRYSFLTQPISVNPGTPGTRETGFTGGGRVSAPPPMQASALLACASRALTLGVVPADTCSTTSTHSLWCKEGGHRSILCRTLLLQPLATAQVMSGIVAHLNWASARHNVRPKRMAAFALLTAGLGLVVLEPYAAVGALGASHGAPGSLTRPATAALQRMHPCCSLPSVTDASHGTIAKAVVPKHAITLRKAALAGSACTRYRTWPSAVIPRAPADAVDHSRCGSRYPQYKRRQHNRAMEAAVRDINELYGGQGIRLTRVDCDDVAWTLQLALVGGCGELAAVVAAEEVEPVEGDDEEVGAGEQQGAGRLS